MKCYGIEFPGQLRLSLELIVPCKGKKQVVASADLAEGLRNEECAECFLELRKDTSSLILFYFNA